MKLEKIFKSYLHPFTSLGTLTSAILLLSSCATTNPDGTMTVAQNTSIEVEPVSVVETLDETTESALAETIEPEEEIVYGNFSEDVLSRVILAEMAGQRGLNQQALDDYLTIARETGDLNIIKRASRIATFSREIPASIEMASMWLELDPDSPEALQTLAFQMISQGRYRQALDHLSHMLEIGSDVDFRLITTRTAVDQNAFLIMDALIADFKDLHEQYNDNLSLHLGLAHLYQQNEQIQEAYDSVTILAAAMDDAPEVVLLEIQLLEQLGEVNKARSRLEESLNSNSDSKQLRLLYGRKLLNEERFAEAQEQFGIIVEQNPQDFEMIYSLALISMEVELYDDARRSFQRLIANSQRLDDAHYYMGVINSQEDSPDQAKEHYLEVTGGNNFLSAQRNLTELMLQDGHYEEASDRLQDIRYKNPDYNISLLEMEANLLLDQGLHETAKPFLNSAVGAFPNNIQLLFLRSVLSQELNNLELMETDLRKVIQLNPNSPVAYNSLGYTLADRTDRYEEAYELIKRAIELSPEDPAIIDSLGWIQYHLGLYDEARENLERAFELFPDHEVAAHLGEVLWVQGKTREANRVWQNALKTQPDSEHILKAIERLTSASSI